MHASIHAFQEVQEGCAVKCLHELISFDRGTPYRGNQLFLIQTTVRKRYFALCARAVRRTERNERGIDDARIRVGVLLRHVPFQDTCVKH
jgi:hypothetical protein